MLSFASFLYPLYTIGKFVPCDIKKLRAAGRVRLYLPCYSTIYEKKVSKKAMRPFNRESCRV